MNFIQDKFITTSRKLLTCLFIFFYIIVAASSCNNDGDNGGDVSSSGPELLAKSEPDECFCGIGAEDNGPIGRSVTGDCSDLTPEEPLAVCLPKRNYSYIWSLTKIGTQVWFGTFQNVLCMFEASFDAFIPVEPRINSLDVCEFDESYVASTKPDPVLGDHRTPKVMVYDTGTGMTQEISVNDCDGGNELLDLTVGMRQAGTFVSGGFRVVIFGGPSFLGGINMFAVDPETKSCLAAKNFPQYSDARGTAITVNGISYSTVGKSIDEESPKGGGRVLRYMGDSSDPLRWEEVGELDTIGTSLTLHEGRLFAGTWPNAIGPGNLPDLFTDPKPGIFMSPILPPEGLTSAHFKDWKKVWESGDYEPDASAAATYGIGALASFAGKLWWGTIHPPYVALAYHALFFQTDFLNPGCQDDPECSARFDEALVNTTRATAIFRGSNFDETPEVEVVYGEATLPAFNPETGQWEQKQNKSSKMPLFGSSGVGNSENFYTWTMAVYGDQLFLGTFENPDEDNVDNPLGADLFRFSDLTSPAEPVTLDGFGNFTNYGFRNLLSDQDKQDGDDGLYIGTANPYNLAPQGGWELWRLR